MRNIQFFSQLIHSYEIQVSLVYEDIFKLFKKKLKMKEIGKKDYYFSLVETSIFIGNIQRTDFVLINHAV